MPPSNASRHRSKQAPQTSYCERSWTQTQAPTRQELVATLEQRCRRCRAKRAAISNTQWLRSHAGAAISSAQWLRSHAGAAVSSAQWPRKHAGAAISSAQWPRKHAGTAIASAQWPRSHAGAAISNAQWLRSHAAAAISSEYTVITGVFERQQATKLLGPESACEASGLRAES